MVPNVPAILEPMANAWVNAGVAATGGELPNLVAGFDGAALEALQALDTESPGNSSCVLVVSPPKAIKRESVGYPRWVDYVKSRELRIARCLCS